MQQQQPSHFNHDSILNIIRMEIYEKIRKLKKAQPDIDTLLEELLTLRRETNALLEA